MKGASMRADRRALLASVRREVAPATRARRLAVRTVAVLALVLGACRERAAPAGRAADSPRARAAAGSAADVRGDRAAPFRFVADQWQPPSEAQIPGDSLGASIRRGLALITNTNDSLPRHAPGNITCSNCHLGGGRNVDAAPLAGSHARFPRYMERTGAVITLGDRVNYCFTRSLAGTRLPPDSREMEDILAYLAFLSAGVPVGASTPGAGGLPAMPVTLVGDAARGEGVFRTTCAACHGAEGQGNARANIPALWGPKSYSVGASMARHERAASFIWHNMPLGNPRSLTHQQAFDVAAYVNGKPRPDSPGKEHDWPQGGAPADVPYDTRGHPAYRPPPLLARADPSGAIVPPPAPVGRDAPRRAP